jgi:type I restriction enzyme S subunit
MNVWQTVSLGEIAESVDYGVTASATQEPKGPKFLRITDIQNGSVNWDMVPYCECDAHARSSSLLRPGDIVFARTGATTGKSFLIRECPVDTVFASYLIRLRLGSGIEPRYVSHFFQTPDYWAQVTTNARGAAQPGVNATNLKALTIRIPSLSEQRRIAEVLDRAEALRAKRLAALGQLEALTRAVFVNMFGDPAQNTKDLPTIALGELGKWQSGGTPPRAREDYFDGKIPWFSSGELNDMYIANSAEHISDAAIRETSVKLVPQGALMLGMYDTAALKASIVGVPCSCNQAIAFAAISPTVAEAVFVYYSIVIGREHFRRLQRGVRQKNLNLSMIREIRIPLPPISSQREFARRVETVERLKATQRISLLEMDALFASLQHRAFRGEL